MDLSNNGWDCERSGYALFEKDPFSKVSNPDTVEMPYSQALRQQLFETLVTQDDHLIHVVGIAKSKNGKLFFILKDSLGQNPFGGYDYLSVSYFGINEMCIRDRQLALWQAKSAYTLMKMQMQAQLVKVFTGNTSRP